MAVRFDRSGHLSRFILDELARTLPRSSHHTGLSADDSRDFVDALSMMVELIEPDEEAVAQAAEVGLRDPADIPVLAPAWPHGPTI